MWQCSCNNYNADGMQRCRCGKTRGVVLPMDIGADLKPKPKECEKTEFGGHVVKRMKKGEKLGEYCVSYLKQVKGGEG